MFVYTLEEYTCRTIKFVNQEESEETWALPLYI